MLIFMSFATAQNDPYAVVSPIPEKMEILPFSAVKPGGWIKKQIRENLDGFTGHLDSLAPDLILADQIYGRDRLTKKVKNKDVGALANGDDVQVQFLWWNSETQSNWRDGYIRSAILAGDTKHLERIKKLLQIRHKYIAFAIHLWLIVHPNVAFCYSCMYCYFGILVTQVYFNILLTIPFFVLL